MKMHTAAGKAVVREQAMLAGLPHRPIDTEDREYYSHPPVFALCHNSGKDPKREDSGFEPRIRVTYSCGYCGLSVRDESTLPKHSRILDKRDQLRETVDTLVEVLGLDRHSDMALRASYAPMYENRSQGYLGWLAESLTILAGGLYRQDATAGVQKAIEALDTVESDGSDTPIMSESFLYDTVGKGEARTILGLWNRVKTAAGR